MMSARPPIHSQRAGSFEMPTSNTNTNNVMQMIPARSSSREDYQQNDARSASRLESQETVRYNNNNAQ